MNTPINGYQNIDKKFVRNERYVCHMLYNENIIFKLAVIYYITINYLFNTI